jgi:hypothetical protein
MKATALALASSLLIGIGSAVAQPGPPPMPAAPPPPQAETVPPPPGTRYVWEPGHWHWNGGQYVWVRGHYVIRQAGWGHYVPGRWVWHPHFQRWDWVPAHWVH